MRETVIEAYLRDRVKALGGKAYKFISPGNNGVPDRLVVIPGLPDFFVETKASGRKSTPLQLTEQARLIRMGRTVYSEVDSKAKVDAVLAKELKDL
jgi:hypothetical protein